MSRIGREHECSKNPSALFQVPVPFFPGLLLSDQLSCTGPIPVIRWLEAISIPRNRRRCDGGNVKSPRTNNLAALIRRENLLQRELGHVVKLGPGNPQNVDKRNSCSPWQDRSARHA